MLFRHRHRRIRYRDRAHVACGLVAILAIVTGCDMTLPPFDENGNDPPPGPTVDGDDGGIFAAGIDSDENTDTVDSDDDGVTDVRDQCPDTPSESGVNSSGCAESQLDGDRDGVTDDRDVCPDTAPRTDVDESGCAILGAECGNGIVEIGEQCDPPDGSTCDGGCLEIAGQPQICGNGVLEAGEGCDDGNTSAGDGCDARCRSEGLQNDSCANALAVGDGRTSFDSTGASTDGPEVAEACGFLDSAQVESDVWFCYSATCGGEVVASLCGSNFDTKMAVYTECDCPTAPLIGCSDDDCGVGMFESRVAFQATAGQSYMIRIGGFEGAQGNGTLTIRCRDDACGSNAGDCFTAREDPGCDDEECCSRTCESDAYCCDVVWDEFCADEALGLCTGNFAACAAGAGSCDTDNGFPGCETAECCNNVCMIDPFCCVDTWDDLCAAEAANICGSSCGGATGSCLLPNGSPGCTAESCCHRICADDPFCCQTEWDQGCADAATQTCG